MGAFLSGMTDEDVSEERKQVLATSVEDIRKHADMIAAVLSQNNICVVGNEDNIEKDKVMFGQTEELFE